MPEFKNCDLKYTQALASKLGKKYKGRDVAIGLIGNLGSGKTAFVKSFAKAFHLNHIQSPTFVIMHNYKIKTQNFYHIDLYRLHQNKQLNPLGLDEILNQSNRVVLIEWVDKFPKIKKKCDLLINFKLTPLFRRDITITQN